MSPKTKDGGWLLDDESASIGYKPYREITEKEKKDKEKKEEEKK